MTKLTAHTAAEANAALAACTGGEIIELDGVTNWRPGSCNFTANPVTLRGVGAGVNGMYAASGASLKGLIIQGLWKTSPTTDYCFRADGSANILFDHTEFTSGSNALGSAFFGRNSSNIEFAFCRVHDIRFGIRPISIVNLSVHDCLFDGMGEDAMQLVDIQGGSILRNIMRNPNYAGLGHMDIIQIYPLAGSGRGCTDIEISDNWGECPGQGLFLTGGTPDPIYQRITINRNTMVVGTACGIGVGRFGADVVTANDNHVYTRPGYEYPATINFYGSTNLAAARNVTHAVDAARPSAPAWVGDIVTSVSHALTPGLTIVEPEADSQRRLVRSRDPGLTTKRTTDWCLDATTAVGHAAGALPGGTLGAGGLVNLANDNAPALPDAVRGAVTGIPVEGSVAFSGAAGARGLSFPGGYIATLQLRKAALAPALVGHPPSEGYLDFLVTAWLRPTALNYWSAFGCSNNTFGSDMVQFWGLSCNEGGSVGENLSGRGVPVLFAGEWAQVGLHYRFDGDAIYVRRFGNGAEIEIAIGQKPIARTRSWMELAPRNTVRTLIGGDNINPGFNGRIARVERAFTSIPGKRLDPARLIAADWLANRARITA